MICSKNFQFEPLKQVTTVKTLFDPKLAVKTARVLQLPAVMNLTELTIIYLACGAPVGVYHFLSNRHRKDTSWLKSFFAALLWIPLCAQLLLVRITKALMQHRNITNFAITEEMAAIDDSKKVFEDFISRKLFAVSLFELREVIDRYAGLTNARNSKVEYPAKHEKELFRIGNDEYTDVSAVCLNRRNRKRLLFHQSEARKDFLKLLGELLTYGEAKKLGKHAIEFAKLLKDDEASASIKNLLKHFPQIAPARTVKELEKALWTQAIPKQPTDEMIPTQLKALTTTAISPTKD